MTRLEWKKNDALMARALKKMGLKFKRDKKTWEAYALYSRIHDYEYGAICYNDEDCIVVDGPNTPESLGEIKYFWLASSKRTAPNYIDNIFFGVKSTEELRIKLDLIA